MKVNDRKGVLNRAVECTAGVRPSDASAAATTPAAPEDRVSVSDAARELSRLRSDLGPVDLVRPEKIASIQDVMAKGQYSADPPRVARDFLREILSQLLS
jgi:flagellar biosynthesis anti-sigma factor FlgM